TDGGKTFPPAINLAGEAFAQEGLRADALRSATTTTAPSPPTTAAAAPSTTTTAPPGSKAAQPNQVANFGGSNPTLAVDRKGNLYAAWVFTSASISPAP